ncbi:hypothetical protein DCD74_02415 [Lysobacter oculi]|uniref:Uncharacterized protein n=1 Tax=Solilutibacter oculi TaxID=2698682 RepID=A0A344J3T7_9GAMM|nr:hypothetical protein DCD74_02415 [Lysobacter oculi]
MAQDVIAKLALQIRPMAKQRLKRLRLAFEEGTDFLTVQLPLMCDRVHAPGGLMHGQGGVHVDLELTFGDVLPRLHVLAQLRVLRDGRGALVPAVAKPGPARTRQHCDHQHCNAGIRKKPRRARQGENLLHGHVGPPGQPAAM